MVIQITDVSIVYFTVCSGADKKKTSKLRVTGLCEENSPVTGEFPSQGASNAENISIWWRHHDTLHHQQSGTTSFIQDSNMFNKWHLQQLSWYLIEYLPSKYTNSQNEISPQQIYKFTEQNISPANIQIHRTKYLPSKYTNSRNKISPQQIYKFTERNITPANIQIHGTNL